MSDGTESSDISHAQIIVAIGASAMETNSVEEFFEQMGSTQGAAFIIVMHHRDAVDDDAFLKRLAAISDRVVTHVVRGGEIIAEHIYIVPPR